MSLTIFPWSFIYTVERGRQSTIGPLSTWIDRWRVTFIFFFFLSRYYTEIMNQITIDILPITLHLRFSILSQIYVTFMLSQRCVIRVLNIKTYPLSLFVKIKKWTMKIMVLGFIERLKPPKFKRELIDPNA